MNVVDGCVIVLVTLARMAAAVNSARSKLVTECQQGRPVVRVELAEACQAEYNLTPEQWQTTLSGIKLTGVSAGSMS